MTRTASTGQWAAPSDTFNPAVPGTRISSTDWTAILADLVAGLNERQMALVVSKTALSNSATTVQAIFAAAGDTLTVAANTTYILRAHIMLNTGATSHTTAFGFTAASTTYTAIHYTALTTSSAAATIATPQMLRVSAGTATVLNAASTAVTTDIKIQGIMSIGTAGTLVPQVTFSAGPTGTCEVEVGSFLELIPVGADTIAAIGSWA